jgi:O-6-methylguanine DNA methyltransferase
MAKETHLRSDFVRRVLSVVKRVPPGRVVTYGMVAELAGRPRAARAVGNIMASCGDRSVPCHRVIAAAGRIGGFGGNIAMKQALLRAEGVRVAGQHVRDWRERAWPAGRGKTNNDAERR